MILLLIALLARSPAPEYPLPPDSYDWKAFFEPKKQRVNRKRFVDDWHDA